MEILIGFQLAKYPYYVNFYGNNTLTGDKVPLTSNIISSSAFIPFILPLEMFYNPSEIDDYGSDKEFVLQIWFQRVGYNEYEASASAANYYLLNKDIDFVFIKILDAINLRFKSSLFLKGYKDAKI